MGKIEYDEVILSDLSDKKMTQFRRSNVGFIFQEYYLLPDLNVENNIRMGGNLAHNTEYEEIIEMLDLKDLLKRMPYQLSGGQQQRVAIARALAKRPKVLCDEPTGALDEKTGKQVLSLLQKYQKKIKLPSFGYPQSGNSCNGNKGGQDEQRPHYSRRTEQEYSGCGRSKVGIIMNSRWIRLLRNNKVNTIGISIIILLTVLLGTVFLETNQNLNDSINLIQEGNIQDFSYYILQIMKYFAISFSPCLNLMKKVLHLQFQLLFRM